MRVFLHQEEIELDQYWRSGGHPRKKGPTLYDLWQKRVRQAGICQGKRRKRFLLFDPRKIHVQKIKNHDRLERNRVTGRKKDQKESSAATNPRREGNVRLGLEFSSFMITVKEWESPGDLRVAALDSEEKKKPSSKGEFSVRNDSEDLTTIRYEKNTSRRGRFIRKRKEGKTSLETPEEVWETLGVSPKRDSFPPMGEKQGRKV